MHDENCSIVIFLVSEEEAKERLDKLLFQHFEKEQSRSYFQRLINDECITVDGKVVKKQFRPKPGSEIAVQFTLVQEVSLEPEDIPLQILWEDEHLLIANKPAGMVVHPAPGNWTGTFANALLFHCGTTLKQDATLRPGIVHRLDKQTSGCIVAAKNLKAQQALVKLFADRQVDKEYIAVCLGAPKEKVTIDASIGRHPIHRKQMMVREEGGRTAITHLERLASDSKRSVVRLLLETGRTHQIRVHLKHHGTPILGDSTYGKEQSNRHYGVDRQMLHAYRLAFKHPVTGESLSVKAPIPPDMQRVIETIDRGLV
jgi:23S rRNA pseudouridine1911/1915/1917 synthase